MKISKIIKTFLIELTDFILRITSNNSTNINIDDSVSPNKEEALSQILGLLNSNGFDYFISGGTLLGIYRDGKLIDWDDDIDIDILNYSYRKKYKKIIDFALENNYAYKLGSNLFHPSISLIIENTKVSIGAISQGVFKRNYFYRSKYRIPYEICKKSRKFKLKNNLFVRIPERAEDYLKYLYGDNWSKPIVWEGDDQDKYYNYGYIRRGKRYVFIDLFQRLLSRLCYLLTD